MDTTSVVWLVAALLVVLVVAVLVRSRTGSRHTDRKRTTAGQLRDEAAARDRRMRQEEAHAAKVQAQAQLAEAEAARQRLEAERLTELAQERLSSARSLRQERDETLREADRHDPDASAAERGGRYAARMRAERLESEARHRDGEGGEDGHDARREARRDG